ncbi:MAG: cell division protein SepF [Aeromicrobium sp.]
MAGAMRRMGEYLGLVEQAEYDEALEYEPEAPARTAAPVRQAAPQQVAPRSVTALDDRRQPGMSVADLARIETVTPRTYNDARTIGESFRSGVPVIMNLSDIGDDDAKRLVDFAAGLVFAVHGTINRITAKVFLLSPEGVQVSDEDRAQLAAGGFYNQS